MAASPAAISAIELLIALDERPHGQAHLVLGERAHLEHAPLEGLELLAEVPCVERHSSHVTSSTA